ncbi:lysophospholipid acyltransferase family protein [Rubripirellula reticaptiva]|uniref:2-acyl-glycerophospho-ethanolamine acyltransferase n=1 Tax=Rubripirellula reticaptiva TaxID=2528013 RepID=A0A5C6EIM1_9BACT|nr:lysophospholipid acyltransferase family protein [Rubripirellula reticaptiva]TWU49593.1 2-acyl-glycerophospho-ethanolamine acyltransferase [Rubripirellula reticaptiva]
MQTNDSNVPEMLVYSEGVYRTAPTRVSWLSRVFPSLNFYRKFGWNVYKSSIKARQGEYDDAEWSRSSHEVITALESVGVKTEVSGIDNVRSLNSPCVFVGNHMSTLETIVMASIIRPVLPVTFVVKQSLIDYPMFRHILRSRNPIAVSRDHPREDFKAVMEGGLSRLKAGISIVVFPQTTRSVTFDPAQFNSIGVKLALRAAVPVVPIALLTDAWGNGKRIKEFGRIDPTKTVRFAFGEPITIEDRSARQHQQVIEFIESKLAQWR